MRGSPQPVYPVQFDSEGAELARAAVCSLNFEEGTRIGAGAEADNASNLWSVTPYLVLVPASGEGFATLNVDAAGFDWLLYSDAELLPQTDPPLERNGPLEECPEQELVEFGGHHHELGSWLLSLGAEPASRVRFFAALSATQHSDLEHAGHAAHLFTESAMDAGHGEDAGH